MPSTADPARRRLYSFSWGSPRSWRIPVALLALTLIVLSVVVGLRVQKMAREMSTESSLGRDELLAGFKALNLGGVGPEPADISAAEANFSRAQIHFESAHSAVSRSLLARALGTLPWVGTQLRAATDLTDLGIHVSQVAELAVPALDSAFVRQSKNGQLAQTGAGERILETLDALDPQLARLNRQIDLAAADRARIPANGLIPQITAAVRAVDTRFDVRTAHAALTGLQQDEMGIRELLGGSAPRKYMVLQQDAAELRPTGGFIGTVGFLDVDRGKLAPFVPVDIEKIDKTPSGGYILGGPGSANHVDPPAPLAASFHLPSWELRDSNWSPDFPTSEREAEFLLDRERSIHVDGVIAIDPHFIESLLAVIGPVKIGGTRIDKDSFFETALKRTESNINATRKDFVAEAGKEIVSQILSLPSSKWLSMLRTIQSGCAMKSLQASFHDSGSESLVNRHACGGRVYRGATDSLMVVETNLGGNKDDFWMKRTYSLEVALNRSGGARHTLRLHYYGLTSLGPALTGWDGYRGWLRVYLPASALLVSASGATLDQTTDLGRGVVEGWFYVKFDQTADLTITYDVDASTMAAGGHEVSISWQKQAGRVSDPIHIKLILPAGSTLDGARVGPQRVKSGAVSSDLLVDRQIIFDYRTIQ